MVCRLLLPIAVLAIARGTQMKWILYLDIACINSHFFLLPPHSPPPNHAPDAVNFNSRHASSLGSHPSYFSFSILIPLAYLVFPFHASGYVSHVCCPPLSLLNIVFCSNNKEGEKECPLPRPSLTHWFLLWSDNGIWLNKTEGISAFNREN